MRDFYCKWIYTYPIKTIFYLLCSKSQFWNRRQANHTKIIKFFPNSSMFSHFEISSGVSKYPTMHSHNFATRSSTNWTELICDVYRSVFTEGNEAHVCHVLSIQARVHFAEHFSNFLMSYQLKPLPISLCKVISEKLLPEMGIFASKREKWIIRMDVLFSSAI